MKATSEHKTCEGASDGVWLDDDGNEITPTALAVRGVRTEWPLLARH